MVANRHHLWYPRASYRTSIERSFRQLPCNIVWLDERIHALIHASQRPPTKPKHDEMVAAIERHANRQCSCYQRR